MRKTRGTVTRISDKGQITLPKPLRQRRGWTGGCEFIVEERPDGVFLRPAAGRALAEIDATFGRLRTTKQGITIDEMQEAMLAEARLRWADSTPEG